MQNELAKTEDLGVALSEEGRWLLVGGCLENEVFKGNAEARKFFTGDLRLDNSRAGILSRSNDRSSTANCDGCDVSSFALRLKSRPFGFKQYLTRQVKVQQEVTPSRETRSHTQNQRDVQADLEGHPHDGARDYAPEAEGAFPEAPGGCSGRHPRRTRRLASPSEPPEDRNAKRRRVSAKQKEANTATARAAVI